MLGEVQHLNAFLKIGLEALVGADLPPQLILQIPLVFRQNLDQVLLDGRLVQPFPERIVVDSCLELLEHLLDRVDQIAILCLLRALFQQIPDENLLILLICDLKGRFF